MMKKIIDQGKFEVSTTREDAIAKFVQIQGISRDSMTSGNRIQFSCNKEGEIVLTNPPSRSTASDNATNLYAEIIEQDGKTYVSYYTSYSNAVRVMKYVAFIFNILIAIICIAVTVITYDKVALLFSGLFFAISLFQFITNPNEQASAPKDSIILIKELEKRVDAVNLWDK